MSKRVSNKDKRDGARSGKAQRRAAQKKRKRMEKAELKAIETAELKARYEAPKVPSKPAVVPTTLPQRIRRMFSRRGS